MWVKVVLQNALWPFYGSPKCFYSVATAGGGAICAWVVLLHTSDRVFHLNTLHTENVMLQRRNMKLEPFFLTC